MSDRKRWLLQWLDEQGFHTPDDLRVRDHGGHITVEFSAEVPDELYDRLRKVLKDKKWSDSVTIYDNALEVLDLGRVDDED